MACCVALSTCQTEGSRGCFSGQVLALPVLCPQGPDSVFGSWTCCELGRCFLRGRRFPVFSSGSRLPPAPQASDSLAAEAVIELMNDTQGVPPKMSAHFESLLSPVRSTRKERNTSGAIRHEAGVHSRGDTPSMTTFSRGSELHASLHECLRGLLHVCSVLY